MSRKLTIDEVKEHFKKRGYELLEKDYLNNKAKMKYRCRRHPDEVLYIKFNSLQQGQGCPFCSQNKLTKPELEFILEHKSLMTYEQIAKELGRTRKYVENKIYKLGLTEKYRSEIRKVLTKEKLYDLYVNQQMSPYQIAKKYNVNHQSIHFLLDSYEIKKRNRSEANLLTSRRNDYDIDFFSRPSNEMYYVLGLLATDGYVNSKTNTIGITLIDEDVIQNIRRLIKSSAPSYEKTYKDGRKTTYTIHFSHPKTKEELIKLEVIPRKSNIMGYPDVPSEYERHFIRGVFEGDGWCSVAQRKKVKPFLRIGFCGGSVDFMSSLKKKLALHGFEGFKIYKKSDRYYVLILHAKDECKAFYEWLYSRCEEDGLFMARKLKKFQSVYIHS